MWKNILFRVLEWLYFYGEDFRIVKIKGWNCFLVDSKSKQRQTVSPIWDWNRFKFLFSRFWYKEPKVIIYNNDTSARYCNKNDTSV